MRKGILYEKGYKGCIVEIFMGGGKSWVYVREYYCIISGKIGGLVGREGWREVNLGEKAGNGVGKKSI